MTIDYAKRILDNAAFISCFHEDDYSMLAANQMMQLADSQVSLITCNQIVFNCYLCFKLLL